MSKPPHSAAGGERNYSNRPLSALEPIDSSPFKPISSGFMVWGSLLLMWVLSLLPWRLWSMAPDLFLMVLCFWALHEPRRITMLVGFVFGLLLDVHGGALLGEHALSYVLAIYAVGLLQRRLLLFNPVVQLIHLFPIWVVALAAARFAHAWFTGEWAGWSWLWSAALMAALWPISDFLLLLPHRRLDDVDENAS